MISPTSKPKLSTKSIGRSSENRVVNARERRELRFRKAVQLSPDFQELWERV